MMPEKLFLIDGTALAYRSYFAMINSNLRNAEGVPTGAIYGFANSLVQLLDKEKPSHLAVAWDTHAPTFRHEMDVNYKANRPPQPEDLRVAIPLIKEMIGYFGFINLEKDGFEADDLIGTLAMQAKNEDVTVFMVTPDKDFMQLVGDNIYMLKPVSKGEGFQVVDSDSVSEFFGVGPESVIDVLALIGDTSDNIPGVPGIGKKGAAEIIRKYGTLQKAIAAAPGMKSKRAREGLVQNKEQALKSRDLIIINTRVPDIVDWKELKWHGYHAAHMVGFFKKMQFRNLTGRFSIESNKSIEENTGRQKSAGGQVSLFDDEYNTDSGRDEDRRRASQVSGEKITKPGLATYSGLQNFSPPDGHSEMESISEYSRFDPQSADYQLVSDMEALKSCLSSIKNSDKWSFDTETTSTDPQKAGLLGISLSCKEGQAWYISVSDFDKNHLIQIINPLFQQENCLKIAHHFKYDYRVLKKFGIEVKGPLFDTMLAAYLLDAGQKMDMNSLARGYLNYDPISIETLIGEKGKQQKSMRDIPLETVSEYACEDADVTFRLYFALSDKLKETNLLSLAEDMEFPLARVLGDMEWHGIKIETDLLNSFSIELDRDIEEIKKQIFDLCGEEFNINSTQQLGNILFEKMNLPSRKKTKTGKYSTSEQVLSQLSAKYKIAEKILDYRGLSKLKSTYVDALPKLIDSQTGRIHSTFNQHVTATGRLSSTNPNLQNIPVRTERGRGIRKAFVAEQGYRIVAADYSQIELRIIASMSGDDAMMWAFHNDEDIHARTAAEIFGLHSIGEVDKEQRRKAKEVNFGIPYGVSSFGLAQRLGITNNEGKSIIDAYFTRFPGIRDFINNTIEYARDHGYVETLSGRRRFIPDIHSANQNIRGFAERTAVNMPIQGTAADLIKVAMLKIDRELTALNSRTRLLMQVHDELVFEVPEDEIEKIPEMVRSTMEHAMILKVPLKADVGISKNWLDAH